MERAHPRYAHEASVSCQVEGRTYQGRTQNVSRGGLCAELAEPLPVGADFEIDLQLVFPDEAQSEPLRLPARVVWCTTVDDAYQIGIAFRPLPAELAGDLGLFLRFLDHGARPERRRRASSLDKRFE